MIDDPTLIALRFGTGLPAPEGAPHSSAAMLARLAGPDHAAARWPVAGIADAAPLTLEVVEARADKTDSPATALRRKAADRAVGAQALAGQRATLARMLGSDDPFRERLVRFWADHFTAEARAARERAFPAAMVEDAIRPHVAGPFAAMLRAVTLHPAMLSYLDQSRSVGPGSVTGLRKGTGLNENLAREVLELHTLGVGGPYAQSDVRSLGALLTGLAQDRDGSFAFRPEMAEPGAETVLGRTYGGEALAPILQALDDLARHPATARHVSRKLAVHFVADTPDEGLIAALSQAFEGAGGDLAAVYAALLAHPAAWAPQAAKIRQPDEFVVAALRGLGVAADDLMTLGQGLFRRLIDAPMAAMGRPWGRPGSPAGFAESAEAWITPQGLAARIRWAMEVPAALRPDLPLPVDVAQATLGPRAGTRLLWAAARAENRAEGVGLVLSSAEFNRR